MKAAFYTLGCKVNRYDTESMRDSFKTAGYEVVDFSDKADIFIINTCTVTHKGARKSRKIARRVRRREEEALIAVVGCYPQVDPEEVLESAEIDLIVGTAGQEQIVEFVEQALKAEKPLDFVQPVEEVEEFKPVDIEDFENRTRATIKIQEGCDQFCSFCIIPYARGRVRSREKEDVLREVEYLVEEGFREVVLTGIHLGEYGKDKKDLTLKDLLEDLVGVENLARIRLSSIEGTEISDQLLDLIAREEKLCPHLHLPLQSGSDKILKAMNRPYEANDFKKMIEKIRRRIPKAAVTTDVIVGFPGETEEDFKATYNLVNKLEFSDVHVFKYSPRSGTPAADFPEQVHSRKKKKRSKKMRDLAKELALRYRKQFVGKKKKVLVENNRDHEPGWLTGLTNNYLRVSIPGAEEEVGKMVTVELDIKEGKLLGELENN